MSGTVFEEWTCIFPGKMGLSWKLAWNASGTKEEAEAQAAKNCNVIAVPVALYKKIREHEHRMVAAERKLIEVAWLRLDYIDGQPVFVDVKPKEKKEAGQ